jgi:hypothetical protein
MLDLKTIEEMQRSLLEEHRKDLEALERLKRFLPKSGAVDVKATEPESGEDDAGPSAGDTIIGKVQEVVFSDYSRRWTVPVVMAELRRQNFPMTAKKPDRTVGLILSKLYARGVLRLVRRGSGRIPNVYRTVAQAPAQEGDSELHLTSERATNGSPLPLDSRLPS